MALPGIHRQVPEPKYSGYPTPHTAPPCRTHEMAYDEQLAERIRWDLERRRVRFEAREMMGGLCVLVDGKMLCGVVFDKKTERDLLMVRIGEEAAVEALKGGACLPMDFTGRVMKGYLFVTPEGFDADGDLARWIDLCLVFNPRAKKSRK